MDGRNFKVPHYFNNVQGWLDMLQSGIRVIGYNTRAIWARNHLAKEENYRLQTKCLIKFLEVYNWVKVLNPINVRIVIEFVKIGFMFKHIEAQIL